MASARPVRAPAEPLPRLTARALVVGAVRIATAAMLGIDAYLHAVDAHFYDAVASSLVSQGTLFRVEAAAAALVAVALLAWPRRPVWGAAVLVAAVGLAAVVVYRYVDFGRLGPLPAMYEPTWSVPGKLLSAYAEGAATLLSAAGLLLSSRSCHSRPASGA